MKFRQSASKNAMSTSKIKNRRKETHCHGIHLNVVLVGRPGPLNRGASTRVTVLCVHGPKPLLLLVVVQNLDMGIGPVKFRSVTMVIGQLAMMMFAWIDQNTVEQTPNANVRFQFQSP